MTISTSDVSRIDRCSHPTLLQTLVGSGISKRRIEQAVRDGRLVRIRHGVYLGSPSWPEDPAEQHLLRASAEHLIKPNAAVSHRSAARYWGLPLSREDWASEPVWLTLPRSGTGRSERGPLLQQCVAELPNEHVITSEDGFDVTTLARTAVDVARGLPLPEALLVLDAAMRAQCSKLVVRVGRRELANPRLVAIAREPFMSAADSLPGMGGVRRVLGFANPLRESPIESLSYGQIVQAGLPLPTCQHEVRTPYGAYFPDFFWEEEGVIGEFDGRLKYVDSGAVMREKECEQVLRDLGFRIVRWSGKEIHLSPKVVMARIERELASEGESRGESHRSRGRGACTSVRRGENHRMAASLGVIHFLRSRIQGSQVLRSLRRCSLPRVHVARFDPPRRRPVVFTLGARRAGFLPLGSMTGARTTLPWVWCACRGQSLRK